MTARTIGLLAGLVMAATLSATEPPPRPETWADPALPNAGGLILWLDAARQPEAWQKHGRPLLTGSRLDVWYDGSGRGLDFLQRRQDSQPRWTAAGQRAVVRFDGADDYLERAGQLLTAETVTVFIVAAPRSNPGFFRGLLSANEPGRNDYTSGLNIDLNGEPSTSLSQINVEGLGFGGAVNLLKDTVPFGEFHVLEVTTQPGRDGVRLWLDGRLQGSRARSPGRLSLGQLTLGARCFNNAGEPPAVTSFLHGDIAEVLVYDRVLPDSERAAVRDYLKAKHAGLTEALAAGERGYLLKPVADPPPVQFLVPGFAVRQLPVDLTNINNVRYRRDGKLFAVAYSGNIYVLSDTDGDGLEDRAELFFEGQGKLRGPIGMALTPPEYPRGDGLFVASKGKLSLIADTDRDGKADQEIVVATGWKEIIQNVDAIGVALAPDGSLYFALGTADFSNAYLIDKEGKAHYDLAGERGTILKVSPDFAKREVVCTGVRFPVALAFNAKGDLFCTDQEGATWLPNGNPFDELLHIIPGRHYGFPPRHPRHLPNVIDEPSVFDYAPQHQSTCGLSFNDPVNGGKTFGPPAWAGHALVCGESRGKLFRTELVKTEAGYVARNHVLACLGYLTVDCCLSPAGDLVVATHTGPPDWGTGPLGKGKLFKVRYRDREFAQPVFAWAAGPREVRIAFDRPLDPLQLRDLARQVKIEAGPYVRPGDRFEVLRPPYAVVRQQMATPRILVPVLSTGLTPDQRTLVLTTAEQTEAVSYAVTLPGPKSANPPGDMPQVPELDIGYDLTGVVADWRAEGGSARWSGWLPHIDLVVARALTAGSAGHEALDKVLRTPGRLTLRTRLKLDHMLHPAIQPGSQLDYVPEPEVVTVTVHSALPFEGRAGSTTLAAVKDTGGRFTARFTPSPKQDEWVPLELSVATGYAGPALSLTWATGEDRRERAFPLRRFMLPWAAAKPAAPVSAARAIPELKGGSWTRGRAVFQSEEAACAKCHTLRGQGGKIGPDLSNLVFRDYDSVLRDLVEPSAALNPDHVTYAIALRDGRVLTGVPRSADGDELVVGDNTGKETTVRRSDIEAMRPVPVSTMPDDLVKKVGPDKLRDLLTYLLTEPLAPAPLERADAPPPRSRKDLAAVLAGSSPPTVSGRKLHVVLVAGPKDHGPGEHDYPLWQRRWLTLLGLADGVLVSEAAGWPTPRQLETADVLVFFSANPAWTAERAMELDAFLDRGGGAVYLHFAVNGQKDVEALAERIGLAARPSTTRFRHGPLDLSFAQREHPITRGFKTTHFVDETYWNLVGRLAEGEVLATAVEDGQPRPQMWVRERGRGRVFVSILGHYNWTFDDPLYRLLVLRGICWAAREPTDRLSDLATIGARVAD